MNPTANRIYFSLCWILLSIPAISQLTADFTVQRPGNCAPSTATIQNHSTSGAGISYLWDLGKGSQFTSSSETLKELYVNPGTYTITLKVIQGTDTVQKSEDIKVFERPNAIFTIDQLQDCVPAEVELKDQSVLGDAPIEQWEWDLRNGITFQTNGDTTITYQDAGTYSLALTVTDTNGCSNYTSMSDIVQLVEQPHINFTADSTRICFTPFLVNFTNLTNADIDLNYEWDFGNGITSTSTDTSVLYEEQGFYDVQLKGYNANGCVDSIIKTDFIKVKGEPFSLELHRVDTILELTENDTICPGEVVLQTYPALDFDSKWIINDSLVINDSIAELYLTGPKMHTIAFITGSGLCPDTVRHKVFVKGAQVDFILSESYACELPMELELTDLSTNVSERTWIFNAGTIGSDSVLVYDVPKPSVSPYIRRPYQNTFAFELDVLLNNGCRQRVQKNLEVDLPTARFAPDKVQGCDTLLVNFADSSHSSSPIQLWTYIIDDDDFVSQSFPNASYNFEEPGEYDIRLVIENDSGCTDTSYAVKIEVGERVEPDFNMDPQSICFGDTIQLTGSTNPNVPVDYWKFSSPGVFNTTGIDTSSELIIPVMPDTSGLYNVHLEVGYNGCTSDTLFSDLLEVKQPTGDYEVLFDCDSAFSYRFVSRLDGADTWDWYINDSLVESNTDTLQHTFLSSIDYEVSIRANNSTSGCDYEYMDTIKVRDLKARILLDSIACVGEDVIFDAHLTEDYLVNCNEEPFLWDFGLDQIPPRRVLDDTTVRPFYSPGTYTITLEAKADNGCVDYDTSQLKVFQPHVSFDADTTKGCAPNLDVTFTNTTTDTTIVMHYWQFGDGEISPINQSVVEHTYTSSGQQYFYANLVGRDQYNCEAKALKVIELIKPYANFQATDPQVCIGSTVNFIRVDSTVTDFEWDFGDGNTSSSADQHTYNESGEFTVSLQVEKSGCVDEYTRINYIQIEDPEASFTLSDTLSDCYPTSISFTHDDNINYVVSNGSWSFGDEGAVSPSYLETANYTYEKPGVYDVALQFSTINGCFAEQKGQITVKGPYATMDIDSTQICPGQDVRFTMNDTIDIVNYEWFFGDGNSSTDFNPVHTYEYFQDGFFLPTLRLSSSACPDLPLVEGDTIWISRLQADFSIDPEKDVYCKGDVINLVNLSDFADQLTWTLNGSETNPQNIELNTIGDYTVELTARDEFCEADTTALIQVAANPEFTVSDNQLICQGIDSAEISVVTDPANQVQWSPDISLSDPNSPITTAFPTQNTEYFASVTTPDGCIQGDFVFVEVDERPEYERYPIADTSIPIGLEIPLGIETDDPLNFTWTPNNNINCVDCQEVVVRPLETTRYQVEMTDDCFTIIENFLVEVDDNIFITVPDAFTPNNDGNNDELTLFYDNIRELVEFSIYNRWGNRVFYTDDLTEGWDGTYKGELQNADTYSFFIEAISTHGITIKEKGTIVLIK